MSYATLSAGSVRHYRLDDNAANTTVAEANGAGDATLQGGNNTADLSVAGPSAAIPAALNFDGTADYADIGVQISDKIPGAYTFVCWAKADVLNAILAFAGERTNPSATAQAGVVWRLRGDQAGDPVQTSHWNIGFSTSGASGITTGWHHVAITFAGGTGGAIKFYLDGESIGSTTTNPLFQEATHTLFIGAQQENGSANQFFNGALADLCIDDREWSQAEIQTFMDGPIPVSGSTVSHPTSRLPSRPVSRLPSIQR